MPPDVKPFLEAFEGAKRSSPAKDDPASAVLRALKPGEEMPFERLIDATRLGPSELFSVLDQLEKFVLVTVKRTADGILVSPTKSGIETALQARQ